MFQQIYVKLVLLTVFVSQSFELRLIKMKLLSNYLKLNYFQFANQKLK